MTAKVRLTPLAHGLDALGKIRGLLESLPFGVLTIGGGGDGGDEIASQGFADRVDCEGRRSGVFEGRR
jgi:hypothetical protein